MHEASLALSLAEIIAEEAARANAEKVTRVILEIGALSHVDPHAMRFAFSSAVMGGPADGAELEIVEPAATAYFFDCDATVEIATRGQSCPTCGRDKLLVQSGEDMKLKALEIV